MKITLLANEHTGSFKINDPTQEQQAKIDVQQILSYHVKGYESMPMFQQGRWDGTSTFFKWSNSTYPAGFVPYLAACLKQKGYDVSLVRKPLPEPLGAVRPKVGNYNEDAKYEYQYETVDKLIKYGQMIAQLATGCHAKGTRVLMYDGTFKNVEDVQVGDALMGVDSRPRWVHKLCRGKDTMYKITPHRYGDSFVVNGGHILSLEQTNLPHNTPNSVFNGTWRNVSVREYLSWGKTQKHIYKLHRSRGIDFYKEDNLPIEPYMLGLLFGDGYLRDSGISITSADAEIESYLKVWSDEHEFSLRIKRTTSKAKEFGFTKFGRLEKCKRKDRVNPLTQSLRDMNLTGKHSEDKFVPEAYKLSSRESRLQLLAGLIDTDGSLCHGQFDYVSKSKQLADDVAFIARSVGLAVSTNTKTINGGDYNGSKFYRVCISGNTEIVPTLIERKKPKPRQQIKDWHLTGFTVEELGEDDYYGFQVDDDNLYLLEDFTVTHNSGKSRVAELAFARIKRPTLFITTRALLMYQMKKRFEEDFKQPVSIIGDGEFGLEGDETKLGMFTVAMVQTLQSRLKGADPQDKGTERLRKLKLQKETQELLKKFEFIVLEEAHESSGTGYFEVCNACKHAAYRLALTATPFMKDDEESNMRLMAVSGPIGMRVSEKMLIDRGILARPFFKFIPVNQRVKYLQKRTQWQSAYRIGIVENDYRNDLIVQEALKAKKHGLSVMCLVLYKTHGTLLKKKMNEAGLKASFIFGENNANERQEKLQELASGDIDVLIGSTILDVGVDVPAVGMVILAGGGKAEVALRQRIGRGLRAKKHGANVCFVVDFEDGYNNHLIAHSAQRKAIVTNTPGFDEGVVDELPYDKYFPLA